MLRRKLRAALQLDLQQCLWLVLIYPLSGIARLMVLSLPFKVVREYLGNYNHNSQLCALSSVEQAEKALKIGRTIRISSKYTLWKSNCMVEAVVAHCFLVWFNISHVIYFGARLDNSSPSEMKAHAWVMTANTYVVGGRGHEAFGVVASYVSFPLSAPQKNTDRNDPQKS